MVTKYQAIIFLKGIAMIYLSFHSMKFFLDNEGYIDTDKPLDISLGLRNTEDNPRAWYVDAPVFEPVRTQFYTGSVAEGGTVNFRNVFFNPHGHGTHTECLGHITQEVHSINQLMQRYFYTAQVVSLEPEVRIVGTAKDRVITLEQVQALEIDCEALVLRTLPNTLAKQTFNYSSTNPAYLEKEIAAYLIQKGVKHLLIDLPSVDREEDAGVLAFHHAFWEVPENPNFERTITELIFVPDTIADGRYVLNIHLAPFENDAAPSRPVLYAIEK